MSTHENKKNCVDPNLNKKLNELLGDNVPMYAKKIGVSEQTIRDHWFKTASPKACYIQKICNVLGISADWLLLDRGSKFLKAQDDTDQDMEPEMSSELMKRIIEEQLLTIANLREENEELKASINPQRDKKTS